MREMTKQLVDRFGVHRNLTFAFMDSFSQSGQNMEDDTQQLHWKNETNKLWSEATGRQKTFDFRTVDDVLEENQRLRDVIDEDIQELKESVSLLNDYVLHNGERISDVFSRAILNTDRIDGNDERISKNIEDIQIISQKENWCGYQDYWFTSNSIISYDKYLLADTNSGQNCLNIQTGHQNV